jgi:two-component system, NtrC family, sensor kinase
LSPKEIKNRLHSRKTRLSKTKPQTRVGRIREPYAELEMKLKEALERQTATSEVLKVISRSAFDLQTVLDTLVESAVRLCEADAAFIWRLEGNLFRPAAMKGVDADFGKFAVEHPPALDRRTASGRSVIEKRTIHIPDVREDPEYQWHGAEKTRSFRTMLGVPLLREGEAFGAFVIWRHTVRPFTDTQIELVTSFADQAMIAIENVRLFEEVEAQRRQTSEALEHQTATSEILDVISRSPTDAQPVVDAIAQSAGRLCQAEYALIWKLEGGRAHVVAANGGDPAFVAYQRDHPISPGHGTVIGRVLLDRRTVYVQDVLADPEYTDLERQRAGRFRTVLAVPLLRGGEPIGVINLIHNALKSFTEKQIELITTFADQAVIAIENVRLFEAEQQRTRELTESLEQQTATSEVLQVISSSPGELEPVFQTMLSNATRICEANFGDLAIAAASTPSPRSHQRVHSHVSEDHLGGARASSPLRASVPASRLRSCRPNRRPQVWPAQSASRNGLRPRPRRFAPPGAHTKPLFRHPGGGRTCGKRHAPRPSFR